MIGGLLWLFSLQLGVEERQEKRRIFQLSFVKWAMLNGINP